jgi:molybdate transport system substrate-binding protein
MGSRFLNHGSLSVALSASCIVVLMSCGSQRSSVPLLCHVGGTMRPAMEELARNYTQQTGQKIDVDYAESGELFIRIDQTRKGDIFVCHDPFFAASVKKGLVAKGWYLSTLEPFIVVNKGNPKGIHGIKDLAKPGLKLLFTHETYHEMGLVPRMADKAGIRKEMEANCSSFSWGGGEAANELELGTADASIVWNAVAFLRKDKIDMVPIEPQYHLQDSVDAVTTATFGKMELSNIKVCIAALSCSKNLEAAEKFAAYCASDEAQKVWVSYGFAPRRGPAAMQ